MAKMTRKTGSASGKGADSGDRSMEGFTTRAKKTVDGGTKGTDLGDPYTFEELAAKLAAERPTVRAVNGYYVRY